MESMKLNICFNSQEKDLYFDGSYNNYESYIILVIENDILFDQKLRNNLKILDPLDRPTIFDLKILDENDYIKFEHSKCYWENRNLINRTMYLKIMFF